MTNGAALPSLATAEWLRDERVRAVFAALDRDGESARIVGGAVRDALTGKTPVDLDFATTATPEVTVARAAAAGIRTVPTGIAHGTVTLVVDGRPFEVTTLREDVETDGRHAVVRFGRDWEADAVRRDFTFNALAVDAAGRVHDPAGGYADLLAGRVRFIGDADRRIREDYLRILRFFRFHAQVGAGEPDRDGLSAAIRNREGLRFLSAERIAQEMRKLVLAPAAAGTLAVMQETGILPIILGGVAFVGAFRRLVDFEAAAGLAPSPALRLAVLGALIAEHADRIADRLKLANAERTTMLAAVETAPAASALPQGQAARALLYRAKPEAWRAGVTFAAAQAGPPWERWAGLLRLADSWPIPALPLSGGDLLARGWPAGRAVGEALRLAESWWIAGDFAADRETLLRRLDQHAAGQQQ